MATNEDGAARGRSMDLPVRLGAIATVLVGLLVLPAVVLALGRYGWAAELGLSTVEFGLVSMLPGLLLGLGAALVILGSN